ncbi:MAG: imidazole glycerol phosphate synthase subunit HisF [Acidimicrobiales bacterium]|nr:imidazole glycerol phosphate synthase subunit HisF [Acidimicrobiales bacterium]MCB1246676.1 imidazole glycerol phosphate synthase subunit HisF [Acidimicrobiia bacterium]
MLKVRIIPTLLYRDFGLVKGERFDSQRAVGSALQAVKVYNLRGVDELMFLDVTATRQDREPDFALIDELADDCFMPLTVGGGIRSVDHARRLLEVGADKVAVGTGVVECEGLVEAIASRFGAQCVVAVIDVRRDDDGRASAWIRSGTSATGLDPVELAVQVERAGAGEILLQSIERDGTMIGYDLDMIASVSDAVSVPVIASGGAGTYEHMVEALGSGASALAAGAIYHFTQQTPMEAKSAIAAAGYPVRR